MKEYNLRKVSIYVGGDIWELLSENLVAGSYTQVLALVDEHTEKYCLPAIVGYLPDVKLIRINSGEQFKTLETAQFIWNELQRLNADRKSVLINVGGGVINDIGGFCASTFKRGIDFINIPTTLLAMVDASVGGKTGIDFNGLKNIIGTFKDAKSTYVNPDFLTTLPREELRNGFAEVIKHALIADKDLWEQLKDTNTEDLQQLNTIINQSIKIKLNVVRKDPHEKSLRKILNFGHTIGHALESYSLAHDTKPLKHGEAVAAGIICEAFLSRELIDFSSRDLRDISEYILSIFPKYTLKSILSPELINLMKHDKKNRKDDVNFTLIKRIGKASFDHLCNEHQIARALNYYDSL